MSEALHEARVRAAKRIIAEAREAGKLTGPKEAEEDTAEILVAVFEACAKGGDWENTDG